MNDLEKQQTIDRYSQRLATFGPTEKALGWGEKGRSKIRFEILLSQWQFSGCSLLDVGCGFGDLFGYMNAKGLTNFSYTGIDINEELVNVARQRYPEARFEVVDLLKDSFSTKHDFVVSSGMFNYKLEQNMLFVESMFEKFNALCTRGFASNFLSNRVQFELEHTFHADPCKLLDLSYKFSNNVVLRNDYMPYEFSVFVDKGSEIDDRLTVYKQYARYEQ